MPRMFTNRMLSASTASAGTSTNTNRMFTNRVFMSRMLTSRMFGQVASSSSTGYPDPANVRDGVTYGASGELEGTAIEFATPLADLDEANLSAFEDAYLQSLETTYDLEGVPADYTSDGTTERITVIIEDKTTTIDDSNNQRKEIEVLRLTVLATIITTPKVGDELTLLASNGTRTYRLTQMPVRSDSHCEWELEFSRSYLKKVGGVKTAPVR